VRAKRDTQSKPEQDAPKIEKEKLRDLTLEHEAEDVRGGAPAGTGTGCQQGGGDNTAWACGS
jgi:hypothetical protein